MLCSAQNNSKKQVQQVFDKLVLAYGNSKAAPNLSYFADGSLKETPALYSTKGKQPTIKFDLKFYKVYQSFGKDSLNAIAIVLGHELAHYYNDHEFCTDYAFAVRDKDKILSAKLRTVNKAQKMSLETQADNKGLFYAAIAGYEPFEIQPQLIDAIYKIYKLKDENSGYPSKTERKVIATTAQEKSKELYSVFKKGLKAIEAKEYNVAIEDFKLLNQHFPSRENYNNSGVAKTLKALDFKARSKGESETPKRFQYPLEIDNTSRLQQEIKRSLDDNTDIMKKLLEDGQKDFQEAIRLDPSYTKSHINLACVYDLLGKHLSAIAEITEKLSKQEQNSMAAKQILAIAYYNADMEGKAEEIWRELKM